MLDLSACRPIVRSLSVIAWDDKEIRKMCEALDFVHESDWSDGADTRTTFRNSSGILFSIHKRANEFIFLQTLLMYSWSPMNLTRGDYSALLRDYNVGYCELIEECRCIVGPEEFEGVRGQAGYPESEIADRLCRWKVLHGFLLVTQEQHTRELPLALGVLLCPE